jgi:hypothetical protein
MYARLRTQPRLSPPPSLVLTAWWRLLCRRCKPPAPRPPLSRCAPSLPDLAALLPAHHHNLHKSCPPRQHEHAVVPVPCRRRRHAVSPCRHACCPPQSPRPLPHHTSGSGGPTPVSICTSHLLHRPCLVTASYTRMAETPHAHGRLPPPPALPPPTPLCVAARERKTRTIAKVLANGKCPRSLLEHRLNDAAWQGCDAMQPGRCGAADAAGDRWGCSELPAQHRVGQSSTGLHIQRAEPPLRVVRMPAHSISADTRALSQRASILAAHAARAPSHTPQSLRFLIEHNSVWDALRRRRR